MPAAIAEAARGRPKSGGRGPRAWAEQPVPGGMGRSGGRFRARAGCAMLGIFEREGIAGGTKFAIVLSTCLHAGGGSRGLRPLSGLGPRISWAIIGRACRGGPILAGRGGPPATEMPPQKKLRQALRCCCRSTGKRLGMQGRDARTAKRTGGH